MSTILALETSCDETAIAILRGTELLASEVASQVAEHEQYGGVVPEVASRSHLVHAPRLLERASAAAGIELREVDAFAATSGPGLASSLMIGASLAKGLALGFRKPYLAINHLEGHLLSPFFLGGSRAAPAAGGRRSVVASRGRVAITEDRAPTEIEPNVSLIVSGGHTLLVEVRGVNDYTILGRTLDDAAGEAFDKVAKMLGLGYPGGPEIERRARAGDPTRFDFPRSMLASGDHNFSFSGLKTAVRYLLAKLPKAADAPEVTNDLCASFQAAVIEVLIKKTVFAALERGLDCVTLSGGVSCNAALRRELEKRCVHEGIGFVPADSALCTDNAAMIAFVASLRFGAGLISNVEDEIDPNLALA